MTGNIADAFSSDIGKGLREAIEKTMANTSLVDGLSFPAQDDLGLHDLQGFLGNSSCSSDAGSCFDARFPQEHISAVEAPDMRPGWHQLVIIGNGFDLECGLPSSFSGFFQAREKWFASVDKVDGPFFTKTIWDVLLKNMGDANWCDIESAIAYWIPPKEDSVEFGESIFGKTLERLVEGQERDSLAYYTSKPEDNLALYIQQRFADDHGTWNYNRLLQITHNDLTQLEHDFSLYLTNAVNSTKDYKQAVGALMSQIILWGRPDEGDFDITESVLSFNYTRIVSVFRSKSRETDYVNIHGRLGKEIVIGIDGTNRMDNPTALPFTKTYRLMALDLPDTGSLIHAPVENSAMDYGTSLVKFYGHSLGEADYAYFQAIFDALKLYGSDTKLVFFFRPHRIEGGEMCSVDIAREEMMKRVVSLLVAYGNTLDNREHGKNLIHKLLIEGRLSVTLLPNTVQRV